MKKKRTKEHRTELRDRVRYHVKESWCLEPGCDYEGKPAVQGHCFHRLDDATDAYLARIEKEAEDSLAHYRATEHGRKYVRTLEALYVCAMSNWTFGLDELVRLRAQNAALRARIGRAK